MGLERDRFISSRIYPENLTFGSGLQLLYESLDLFHASVHLHGEDFIGARDVDFVAEGFGHLAEAIDSGPKFSFILLEAGPDRGLGVGSWCFFIFFQRVGGWGRFWHAGAMFLGQGQTSGGRRYCEYEIASRFLHRPPSEKGRCKV